MDSSARAPTAADKAKAKYVANTSRRIGSPMGQRIPRFPSRYNYDVSYEGDRDEKLTGADGPENAHLAKKQVRWTPALLATLDRGIRHAITSSNTPTPTSITKVASRANFERYKTNLDYAIAQRERVRLQKAKNLTTEHNAVAAAADDDGDDGDDDDADEEDFDFCEGIEDEAEDEAAKKNKGKHVKVQDDLEDDLENEDEDEGEEGEEIEDLKTRVRVLYGGL